MQDSMGRMYYCNDATGESKWEVPEQPEPTRENSSSIQALHTGHQAGLARHFAASIVQHGGCLPELKQAQELRNITGQLRVLEARFEKAEEAYAELQERYAVSIDANAKLEGCIKKSEAAFSELQATRSELSVDCE